MKKILLFNLFLALLFAAALSSTAQLVEVPLGTSGNQQTNSNGVYTNLWYDKDLNSIVFFHRSNDQAGWPNIANILYDYSTDDGLTWLSDQGPVYADTANLVRARYPQGIIYNPIGNTNIANAFVSCYGPSSDGANWVGHYEGTNQFGSLTGNQNIFRFDSAGLTPLIPQSGMVVKNTGTVWWATQGYDGTGYNDTVTLSKGVFSSFYNDFSYSFIKLIAPMCWDVEGKKMFRNQAIAFNDSGNIGYVAMLGNDWVCSSQPSDSAMGIIVYKTIDSGATWNRVTGINLNLVDLLLLNNGSNYQCGTQLDVGVDKNNNLHIGLPVLPFSPGNTLYPRYPYASWGLFDISTSDGGVTWDACLIANPKSYLGDFFMFMIGLIEDNRMQFSRSWDGSKIFFTWFDTDTVVYGSVGNTRSDMHTVGYDVDQNLRTAEFNFTAGTGLFCDGNSIFGNVSYYTINDGVNENIPMVFDTLSLQITATVVFFYVGNAAVSGYNLTNNCVQLIDKVSENNFHSSDFSISSPYPNPFSQKTSLDITLSKTSDVTVEITNAIGQKFSSVTYLNLHSGKNTVTVDGSSLSRGLYFYTVRVGSDAVTKMMSVE